MADEPHLTLQSKVMEHHLRLAMQVTVIIIILTTVYECYRFVKTPYNDSTLTGAKYTKFLLCGNRSRCRTMLRLNPDTFELLALKLSHIDNDPVSRISMEEQLAIFMYIVGHGASNRQAQDQFQHSGETISRIFHHIIHLLIDLSPLYVKLPKPGATHPTILDNPKFSPFFDDCLGALDGVHVQAKVPEDLVAPYCSRKGTLSQNVLGVVDFNMRFTYVCAGWEGSAHDSRVLSHARSIDFAIPSGSFYLADAGYPLTHGILVPY